MHTATVSWKRSTDDFAYDSYNRAHDWHFDSGNDLRASAAPDFRGDPDRVDPESAFVASLSSCHMLTFLALAARKRYVVDSYKDDAVGYLEKNADGKFAMTRVELHPQIEFSGEKIPSAEELEALHERAHEDCFIANSVTTSVIVK